MNSKTLISIIVVGFIFFSATAQAYDLPKIYPNKKGTTIVPMGKSDWQSEENFEQKIKALLAENENLPAASKERINNDKNLIFVGFYKGNAYFLDRYSIQIQKNNSKIKSWKQHIFPIGKGISPKNAKYTNQKFSLQNGNFYNSLKAKDEISEVEDSDDKKFLAECFKVGYYYAFKRELDISKIF